MRAHVKVGSGNQSCVTRGREAGSEGQACRRIRLREEWQRPRESCTGRPGHMDHDRIAKPRVARFCGATTPITPPVGPLAGAVKSVPSTVSAGSTTGGSTEDRRGMKWRYRQISDLPQDTDKEGLHPQQLAA